MAEKEGTGRASAGPQEVEFLGNDWCVTRGGSADQVNSAPLLRPYQQDGVDKIRAAFAHGAQRVLFQLPTGAGKTITFAFVIAAAVAKGSGVLILVHRIELVEQIAGTLARFGVQHGIVAAGYPEVDAPVQVASVFTLARRLDDIGNYDLVVIDECHHAIANTWRKILDALPRAWVLGVSATPQRADGRGLKDIFQTMVLGPSVRELIEQGHLARYVAYGPKDGPDLGGVKINGGDYQIDQLAEAMGKGVVIDSAVSNYERICKGARAIVFCVDIAHSKKVVQAFRDAGFQAAHVDGETPRDERRDLIAALGDGRLQVLTNCGLISEGVDVPAVEAAILLRPTLSLPLYLQQVGRALRPGKPRAFLLDHAGCFFRHGLPDAEREWTLEDQPRNASRNRAVQCEACGAFSPPKATHCQGCGAALPGHERPKSTQPKVRDQIESELSEIDAEEMAWLARAPFRDVDEWAGRDRRRLERVAMARGYKIGWVYHRMKEPRVQERSAS